MKSTIDTVDTEFWVICPVCQQASPSGTRFCKHCWGAMLHTDSPVFSRQEMEKLSKRRLSYLKRRKTFKVIAISLASLLTLGSAVYSSLFYLTDVLFKPAQAVNSNSLPGQWAMFRHDLGRSGTTDPAGALPQGTMKWVFSTGGAIHSSPAVANGIVYFGSRDNKLYALDAATGTKHWEFETGSWVESSPAIVNGVVYFGSNDGRFYALDANSGEKLWDFKAKYPIMSSPAVANGIVYFGADDYYIYALDALSGAELWKFDTKGSVKSSPTVANGIVYTGSGGKFTYALDGLSGRLRLQFKTIYPVTSSPAVKDGTVYFSNFNGFLHVIDGKARSWPREHLIKPYWIQVWAMGVPIPAPPTQSGFLWGLRIGRRSSSSPVVTDDTLYIGSDNRLLAIDLQSHQRRWVFRTGGPVRSSPALADTTIYVGSEDGRLYAVDAATGKKLWDVLTGGKITSSPAVSGGTVFIGSYDGNLYAIK